MRQEKGGRQGHGEDKVNLLLDVNNNEQTQIKQDFNIKVKTQGGRAQNKNLKLSEYSKH
jgi:hypothetical protein